MGNSGAGANGSLSDIAWKDYCEGHKKELEFLYPKGVPKLFEAPYFLEFELYDKIVGGRVITMDYVASAEATVAAIQEETIAKQMAKTSTPTLYSKFVAPQPMLAAAKRQLTPKQVNCLF
jgi:hypothetical protein